MVQYDEKRSLFRYANFDVNALCSIASQQREGIPCSCDLDQHPASGSFNWAVTVLFKDGVEWILRSPRDDSTQISKEVSAKLLSSEAATLNYLSAHTDIPVPKVHSYCAIPENEIGIPFILMSKANGRPLDKVWGLSHSDNQLSSAMKSKVLFQLGSITWKLAQIRFDHIGSLFEENGSFVIGESLSRGHLLHERHSLEDIPHGPFAESDEFYHILISAFKQHAEILPLTHHCFAVPLPSAGDFEDDAEYLKACDIWNDIVTVGANIDSAENRLDYVIAGDALHDLIRRKSSTWPEITLTNPFSLHHPGLSANNIFVDDDRNITCIIDWAFSSTVPSQLLLAPPGLPQSRYPLDRGLLSDFRNGYQEASSSGHPNNADTFLVSGAIQLLEDSLFAWSLIRLLSFDSTDDLGLFRKLWEAVHRSDSMLESYISLQRSLPHYQKLYQEIKAEDESFAEIQKLEGDYFRSNPSDQSLARYLTLISNWNSQYTGLDHTGIRKTNHMFIAEPQLWRWLNNYKKSRRLLKCSLGPKKTSNT
ncbi:unnamed protein product [Penicillium salamii]|uniref:Aminoglycoside phosphotransferase domain-containing protein n=1 Tax=Penicillium salamii TaxID=1612424 RepID=A0A9W4MZ04_9EURO|nr:unnamed protein product [Penicillium salamii]